MPPVEEAYRAGDARDPAGPAAKPTCAARLFPSSREKSPVCAFTEPQDAAKRNILSPNTLHKVASEQIKAGDCTNPEKKKAQKRSKKGASSSQPPMPIRAQDGPPRPKDISWEIHVAGRPMLPKDMIELATSDMRSLHDTILTIETRLLRENALVPGFHGQGAT